MTGHLDLVCAPDGEGRSFLRAQSFAAPLHLSKAYREENVLVVNAINQTAGLFGGDTLRYRIRVEAGANLLLTSPSANRIHEKSASEASVTQNFSVAAGGWLELLPHLIIPQARSRFRQTTEVELDAGAEFMSLEMLAPGRVASGEVFAFAALEWTTEIRMDARLVLRERYALTDENGALIPLRKLFATPYLGSCVVFSERLTAENPCWRDIAELHHDDLWLGHSRLSGGSGVMIRLIARDSVALMKAMGFIRVRLCQAIGRAAVSLRRV